jgi:tetratricopeptide (TPR) repeat protein
MAGIGKTALAIQAAEQLPDQYPDAQLYIDLKGNDPAPLSVAAAMRRILYALDPTVDLSEDIGSLAALYPALLHGRRILLLLDNAAGGQQVTPLLPPGGCAALITARRPLDLATTCKLELPMLPPEDARTLLDKLVPRLAGKNGQLARSCGYMPSVLRMAGGTLAKQDDLTSEQYLEQLREAQTHHPLIDAALSVCDALLGEQERRQWPVLALCPGPLTRAAAATAWQTEPDVAQGMLSELLGYGLVEQSARLSRPAHQARYRLSETVRSYAGTRMNETQPPRAGVQERLAAHYLAVLQRAEELCAPGETPEEPGQPEKGQAEGCRQQASHLVYRLRLLDLDWDNIQAGQQWAAADLDQNRLAAQLCSAYAQAGVHCRARRQSVEARIQWLQDALRAARRLQKPETEGRHLARLADATLSQGEPTRALAYYRQALGIARRLGDDKAEEEHTGNLGLVYSTLGDTERAFIYYQQALSAARKNGNRAGQGNWLGNLGSAYRALGEAERAIDCHKRALAIAREVRDRRAEAIWLGNLGNSFIAWGKPKRAAELYERALPITRETGDRQQEQHLLGNLGNAYSSMGKGQEAIQAYERALDIARELQDRGGIGIWLLNMSLVLDELGNRAGALERAQDALQALEEIGSPDADAARALVQDWQRPAE